MSHNISYPKALRDITAANLATMKVSADKELAGDSGRDRNVTF